MLPETLVGPVAVLAERKVPKDLKKIKQFTVYIIKDIAEQSS